LQAGRTLTPAQAQDDLSKPPMRPIVRRLGRMPGGPATLAASGDYVYVLRGNTLYQMKASDLSLVTQKDLPVTDTAPAEVQPCRLRPHRKPNPSGASNDNPDIALPSPGKPGEGSFIRLARNETLRTRNSILTCLRFTRMGCRDGMPLA